MVRSATSSWVATSWTPLSIPLLTDTTWSCRRTPLWRDRASSALMALNLRLNSVILYFHNFSTCLLKCSSILTTGTQGPTFKTKASWKAQMEMKIYLISLEHILLIIPISQVKHPCWIHQRLPDQPINNSLPIQTRSSTFSQLSDITEKSSKTVQTKDKIKQRAVTYLCRMTVTRMRWTLVLTSARWILTCIPTCLAPNPTLCLWWAKICCSTSIKKTMKIISQNW